MIKGSNNNKISPGQIDLSDYYDIPRSDTLLSSKKNKNETFNVVDSDGNDQTSANLNSTYPIADFPVGTFRYSDEGTASETLYFRNTETTWINFSSHSVNASLYARTFGDETQSFKVADAVNDEDAVSFRQLKEQSNAIEVSDSFYLDSDNVLRVNLPEFKEYFQYEDIVNNTVTTSFEIVEIKDIVVRGQELNPINYILTSEKVIELTGTFQVDDWIKVSYTHFVIKPNY